MNKKTSVIVIPVLNPNEQLEKYIYELIQNGFDKIIVVDDGSDEKYQSVFEQLKKIPQVDLCVHQINKGKGRAIKTAIRHYCNHKLDEIYDGIITVDADGQHILPDVLKVSEALKCGQDSLVLGERKFDKDVPFRSRFGNGCTRTLFNLLYGMHLYDTQTGLRGIPNNLLSEFESLDGERYEYEMNMLIACSRKKIAITSVEISTIYIDDNKESHFNPLIDSYKIYKLIFKEFGTYLLSSIGASIIDIGVFHILILVLANRSKNYILFSTIFARVVSSIFNYAINRKIVFKSNSSLIKTLCKYYGLCIVQMLLSAFLVTQIFTLLPVAETLIKIVVDIVLFFISYQIQKKLIFK